MPAVLGTQLCASRSSYWEQTKPAGLNTCTEALENVVKPYLDNRLADSDKQFFIRLVVDCGLSPISLDLVQLVLYNNKGNDNWKHILCKDSSFICMCRPKMYWFPI